MKLSLKRGMEDSGTQGRKDSTWREHRCPGPEAQVTFGVKGSTRRQVSLQCSDWGQGDMQAALGS